MQISNFISCESPKAVALSAGLVSISAQASPTMRGSWSSAPFQFLFETLPSTLSGTIPLYVSVFCFLLSGFILIFFDGEPEKCPTCGVYSNPKNEKPWVPLRRKMLYVMLVLSVIVGGGNFLSMLGVFGSGGVI